MRNATESSNPGVMQSVVAPVVKKKGGTWRLRLYYYRLNFISKKDVQPLVGIEDALDCLHSASYFCGFAIRVPANPNAPGLVELNIMLFGLCKAPATFERFMDTIL